MLMRKRRLFNKKEITVLLLLPGRAVSYPRDLTLDQDLLRVFFVPRKHTRQIFFRNIRCNMSVPRTLNAELYNFMDN
jgi:hypothetical protein